MLMKAIKSVFNFYMLCVQPLLGLFLVGYSIWRFSGNQTLGHFRGFSIYGTLHR